MKITIAGSAVNRHTINNTNHAAQSHVGVSL
jgi:hypothetical protein